MGLYVEELPARTTSIGLSRTALQAAAENPLRAERLYDAGEADFAHLCVNVNVVGPAFSILVEYKKVVSDEFGTRAPATTWHVDSTGTSGNAGYIVSALSPDQDTFLAAYLRVNDKACGALVLGVDSDEGEWIARRRTDAGNGRLGDGRLSLTSGACKLPRARFGF